MMLLRFLTRLALLSVVALCASCAKKADHAPIPPDLSYLMSDGPVLVDNPATKGEFIKWSGNIQDLDQRLRLYNRKGFDIRQKHHDASGEALRTYRREAAIAFLEGLAEGQKAQLELKKKIDPFEPDLQRMDQLQNIFHPMVIESMKNNNMATSYVARYAREIDEYNKLSARLREKDFGAAYEYRRLLEPMSMTMEGLMTNIADIYSTKPYDIDELKSLSTRYLGDTALARDVVSKTERETAAREKAEKEYNTPGLNNL